MGEVVDLTGRIRGKHFPVRVRHPSGMIIASGMPSVEVCVVCRTVWPCSTAQRLNDNNK